jgi:hypothetical protein
MNRVSTKTHGWQTVVGFFALTAARPESRGGTVEAPMTEMTYEQIN